MSLYAAVEAALVSRLDSLRGLRVQAYPDDAKQLGKATPSARILVGYQSSAFRVISEAPMTEEETLTYEITLEMKGLRTHSGAYPYLSQIKTLLNGFMPISGNLRPLRLRSIGFKGVENGLWYYAMSLSLPVVIVAGQEDYTPMTPLPRPTDPTDIQILSGVWRSQTDRLQEPQSTVLDREFSASFIPGG